MKSKKVYNLKTKIYEEWAENNIKNKFLATTLK